MKKWIYFLNIILLVICFNCIGATDKIAVVNISDVFQKSSQRAETIKFLEDEFKDRANELEMIERDLHMKMQSLQKDSATMKVDERNKLEQSLIHQREILSNKVKIFQQDNHTRQIEERDKILNIIQNIVKNIAKKENCDIVIDTNAVVYHNNHIRDITYIVMKEVG